jgi:DNA-binding ferritin-like protein
MSKEKKEEKSKRKIAHELVEMIDEGSENVTTLSADPEAKYESIAELIPIENSSVKVKSK